MSCSREMKNSEVKTLLTIVEDPEQSYTRLIKNKKIAKSNNTIHNALKFLEKQNLVKWRKGENEQSGTVGRRSTYYRLNLFGLLRLFYHFRNDENKLLKIFQKKIVKSLGSERVPLIVDMFKEDIPLVFGQWNYFKEKGVEEIAEKHLVDTLKYCGEDYKRFLEGLDEPTKPKRFTSLRKQLEEKWKQEKSWAAFITSTFLYYSFHDNRMIDSHRIIFSNVQYDEQKKLHQAIQKKDQLRLYCLMCTRKEASFNTSQSRKFKQWEDRDRNLILDTSTVETKIHNIMWGKMRERAGKPDPFQKIANLALIEDWFSVAFELCNLYKNYTFNSEKEALQKIGSFSQFLAELRYGCVLNPLNSQESYDKLTKEQKDVLRKQEVGTRAALYFFTFTPVQVWDKTYYQLTPNIESMKKLKENRDVTIEAAKFLVRRDLKELESTEKER